MNFLDINIHEFAKEILHKKVVCYGAGGTLREFCDMYGSLQIQNRILCIIDSDERKNGTRIEIGGRDIEVISLQNFLKRNNKEYVILLSCQDAFSIYQMFQENEMLKDIACCYTEFIKYRTKEMEESCRIYPESFRILNEIQIPKVIHYCWFGGKPMPEANKKWIDSWKKVCPDYDIIEWNESNYDVSKNRFMREAYEARAWGFVPDYARLDIIYHYGGIYLDTDVEVVKKPDELLYQNGFMGIDSSKDISLGLGFGSVKGNGIIGKLLDAYEGINFHTGAQVAAPAMQRKIFNELGYMNNGELQYLEDVTVYPEKVLSGKDNIVGLVSTQPQTFFVHHYDGSWCNESQIARRNRMHQFFAEVAKK